MKTLNYQQKAVSELVEKTLYLLRLQEDRKKIVFKAPTGSGKTVMLYMMLDELTERLKSMTNSPYRRVAYVWVAPQKLHKQSYDKMKSFFNETRALNPVMFDEIDQAEGVLAEGDVLFINWESVNKDSNLIMKDTEQRASLKEVIRRTREELGVPIVIIVDEEHQHWDGTADKSAKVMNELKPTVEIRVSATPKTASGHTVTVERKDVVGEEMIKKYLTLNPDISQPDAEHKNMEHRLIDLALKRRDMLAAEYEREGSQVKPLMLIQLPNDNKEKMDADERKMMERVKDYLREVHDITTDNGRLAILLSEEKKNLEGLEDNTNDTMVLLFKEAIALGWDCPRACVLLIFRKHKSKEFKIQTLGRIMRMPEHKHYKRETLNVGYVYTDIESNKVNIMNDDNYVDRTSLLAKRRENLTNVKLTSYQETSENKPRLRLGYKFKQVLKERHVEKWGLYTKPGPNGEVAAALNRHRMTEFGINMKPDNVNVRIPENIVIVNEIGIQDFNNLATFSRTHDEIEYLYNDTCESMLEGFDRLQGVSMLAGYQEEVMEELFDLYGTEARRVVLCEENIERFKAVIIEALNQYKTFLENKNSNHRENTYTRYEWEVPPERRYVPLSHNKSPKVKHHALTPFFERNDASAPERSFVEYLETNNEYIDWWYKNGDRGNEHYSVRYKKKDGHESLFYVDFIIRMKNGQVFLFDTKTKGSDEDAPSKHNALLEYMRSQENSGQRLRGGVIIEDRGLWLYSEREIDNTTDLSEWTAFTPRDYKQKDGNVNYE